jgi:replicative DNA helicase
MNYSNPMTLPNNFLAEQAILNILLTNTSLVKEALLDLKPETFYFEPHRLIYETIIEVYEKNYGTNITLIITSLQDKNILKKVGGLQRIVTIIAGFENFSDLNIYIKEVNDKHLRRIIIETGKQIITWGHETSDDLESILDKMENSIFSLNQEKLSQKVYSAEEVMNDVFNEIKQKIKKVTITGLNSSFKDLDSIIQGFQKSDLIIVAGRPSMGKTAFSLNLGKNIVEKYNVPLLIFSLEMSRQQIIYRFISTDSNINANRLKSAKMSTLEWKNLDISMKKISELPIFIDDNPNLTLMDIRLRLRKIFTKKVSNGLVIIDYLQLMKLSSKLENRVQEISYITRNLKILAKEFKIPIMVLSQLSRNVESRTNKRPMLSDLRESGCLANINTNRFSSIEYVKKLNTTKTLENIPFQKEKIKSWNQNILVNEESLSFDFKGIKPTFLITLTNDTKICLTSNHRILSRDGWIRSFQIQKETEIYYLLKSKQKEKVFKYSYCKIKSILYQGINKVYDKTIPGFHNYLSEDIVLHNSIEQDADIVIMLYREEYYNDSISEEQITEVIVAKHRNGPIGTAKLLFKPSVTSFVNL